MNTTAKPAKMKNINVSTEFDGKLFSGPPMPVNEFCKSEPFEETAVPMRESKRKKMKIIFKNDLILKDMRTTPSQKQGI